MRIRSTLATAMAVLGMLLAPAVAGADTSDVLEPQSSPQTRFDGFLAGPCATDVPTCSPATPGQHFMLAGGHPPVNFFNITVQHEVIEEDVIEPVVLPLGPRSPRNIRIDLPPGLTINPEAASETCTLGDLEASICAGKPGAKVGEILLNAISPTGFLSIPKGGFFFKGVQNGGRLDLFRLEPFFGQPALFGFRTIVGTFLLQPRVAWESDFHQIAEIVGLPDLPTEFPIVALHSTRSSIFGTRGDGTAVTLPTTCFDPADARFGRLYSNWVRIDSHAQPDSSFPSGTNAFEAPLPPGMRPEGCENVPFEPSIEVAPGHTEIDSAASPTVTTRLKVEVPEQGDGPIASSHLRTVEVTLPAGMGLNPAASLGLAVCTDAQFNKGERRNRNECPDRSIVGSAEIRTPLVAETLRGNVYVGEPKSTDPASGEQFRIFVEAKSIERGVIARLIGNVKADPRTGQLTTRFDDQLVGELAGALPHGLPQVPFSSLTLRLNGTPKFFTPPLLTTPPTCSRATTTARMEPWARPGTSATRTSSFTLTSAPGGGACPRNMRERPFAPLYGVKADSARGGTYSPLRIQFVRPEGQQELKALDLTLPKGLIGRLAGIPYCPEGAIAAAGSKSGAAERQTPSCPAASAIATTATESGSGNDPLRLPGKLYLAGPYKGAPLSVVAITPGVSGPFDLGNVVIRVALRLDPQTAQVIATSDVLPDVFGGVKISLREIEVNLDRNQFMVNPTNCSALAATGAFAGGGADPANPAGFSSYALNAPFRATGCDALGFKPKLTTTVSGPTKRGKYPSVSARLEPRPGDANLASLALTLPPSFFVAQEHLTALCSRTQLASRSCPPGSAYGEAKATSPLIDAPLSGPVYLVPSGNQLPDLVIDLHGLIDVQLRGVISSKGGGIRTVFEGAPDVPLDEFVLQLAGGKQSLLVNSKDICKGKRFAVLSATGHNGARLDEGKYKLSLTNCKKRKKRVKR